MKKLFLLIISIVVLSSYSYDRFKSEQLKFERVKEAYVHKETELKKLLKSRNIEWEKLSIFIRAFKHEKELEVWARNGCSGVFSLIKTYAICQTSGYLGPKRKIGDRQTPEGFYYIDRFNPKSNFHLSLGINYPNQSDKILGDTNPGGDIFIHGSCVTIGCIPLTDEYIEEVYLLALEAKDNGQQQIPVHIFPYRLDQKIPVTGCSNQQSFWNNLKEGYDYFEKHRVLPPVSVLASGKYCFRK